MANQTLDNLLFFSNGYGVICAQDANHQIVIRGDRCGAAGDYTNYYQHSGTLASGNGHKFWTGGVIGVQTLKFHIADDGNYMACRFGIGVASACSQLDVYKAGSGATGTGDNLILRGGNNNNTFGSNQIRFGYGGGIGYSHVIKSRHNSEVNTDNALDFFLWNTTDAIETAGTRNVMTLTGCGKVGIGTCSPTNTLDVVGDTSLRGDIIFNKGSRTTIYPSAANQNLHMKSNGCGLLQFNNDNTGNVSIATGGGRLGIGTDSPCNLLHVNGGGLIRNGGTDTVGCRAMGLTVDIASCAYAGADVQDSNRHMALISNVDNRAITLTLRNLSRGRFWDIVNEGTNTDKLLFNTWCNTDGGYFNRVTIEGSTGNMGINTCTPGTYKLNVNGAFYAAGSSKEYKTSICEYNTDSCMFMKLKPVTYDYKEEWKHLGKQLKSGTQIGLIAEDTAEVFPELAVLKEEENEQVVRNVDYEKLTILLLSELQKLRREVDDLKHK